MTNPRDILDLRAKVGGGGEAVSALQSIKRALEDVGRSPAGRQLKREMGEITEAVNALGFSANGVLGPALRSVTSHGLGIVGVMGGVAGSMVAAIVALKRYADQTMELKFASDETGFSLSRLQKTQMVLGQLGVGPEAAIGGLRTFSEKLYGIKLQSQEVVEFFAKHQALGFYRNLREDILTHDPAQALERTMTALQKLKDPHDRGVLATFLFGSPEFGRLTSDEFQRVAKELGDLKPPDAAEAQRFNTELFRMNVELEKLKITLGNWAFPGFSRWLSELNGSRKVPGVPQGESTSDQFSRENSEMWGKIKSLFTFGGKGDTGKGDAEEGAERGTERGLVKGAPEAGKEIGKSIWDYWQLQSYTPGGGGGGGFTMTGGPRSLAMPGGPSNASYEPGGGVETRGVRNNNPGNLKFGEFAKAHGATGADAGGFAIFPDRDAGEAAQGALLKQKYSGMTLEQIARKYEATGNWPNWMGNVSRATGLRPNDVPNFDDPAKLKEFQRGIWGAEGTLGASTSFGPNRPMELAGDMSKAGSTLVTAPISGRKFRVSSLFASNFQTFLNKYELQEGGLIGPNSGGERNGDPRKHGWGMAIDVNQIARNQRKGGKTLPQDVEDRIAAESGLYPGSKFRSGGPDAGHFEVSRELMRDALRRHNNPATRIDGSARIRVDVNAPKGTRVGAEADGLFNQVEINRGSQMPLSPSDGVPGDGVPF